MCEREEKRKQFERKQVERGVEVGGRHARQCCGERLQMAALPQVSLQSLACVMRRDLPDSEMFPSASSADVFERGNIKWLWEQ